MAGLRGGGGEGVKDYDSRELFYDSVEMCYDSHELCYAGE